MKSSSGKFVVRISPELHDTLRQRSAKLGLSLNQLCVQLLERDSSTTKEKTSSAKRLATPTPLPTSPLGSTIPGEVIESVLANWGERIEGIVLFGSAARGEVWKSSDLDLLVVFATSVAITRKLYEEWDEVISPAIPLSFRSKISPQFVQYPKSLDSLGGLWYEVALDGILLWDPLLRVANVLQKLRNQIVDGEVVRHNIHGHSYWVKPKEAA